MPEPRSCSFGTPFSSTPLASRLHGMGLLCILRRLALVFVLLDLCSRGLAITVLSSISLQEVSATESMALVEITTSTTYPYYLTNSSLFEAPSFAGGSVSVSDLTTNTSCPRCDPSLFHILGLEYIKFISFIFLPLFIWRPGMAVISLPDCAFHSLLTLNITLPLLPSLLLF